MQVLVEPDGRRNRQYRPYIFGEETTYNSVLYDPFRAPHYGLYDGPQGIFQNWRAHVSDYVTEVQQERSGYKPRNDAEIFAQYPYENHAVSHSADGRQRLYRRLYAT